MGSKILKIAVDIVINTVLKFSFSLCSFSYKLLRAREKMLKAKLLKMETVGASLHTPFSF